MKKKKNENEYSTYLKKKLGDVFTADELSVGGFETTTHNFKGTKISVKALSPGILWETLKTAEILYPTQYKTVNIPHLINEKCRKKRGYVKRGNIFDVFLVCKYVIIIL